MKILTRASSLVLFATTLAGWAAAVPSHENLPSAEWIVSNIVRRVDFSSQVTGAKPSGLFPGLIRQLLEPVRSILPGA